MSFAALARFMRDIMGPHSTLILTPRLFISKLENGSVIAEIVPYVVMLGQLYRSCSKPWWLRISPVEWARQSVRFQVRRQPLQK